MARRDAPLSLVDVVNHTRPPATTGEDQPRPGTGVFHTTLRDSLHSSGRPVSDEWPWPVGPRNCGQSAARSSIAVSVNAQQTTRLDAAHAPQTRNTLIALLQRQLHRPQL